MDGGEKRGCKRPRMERTAAELRLREMTVCTCKLMAAMTANTRPAWDRAGQCSNGGRGTTHRWEKEGDTTYATTGIGPDGVC